METILVNTTTHTGTVDISRQVAARLKEIGAQDGICLIYIPHTTAAVTINEGADPDVMIDVIGALEKLAPWRNGYRHSEGNSAAHIKAVLVGGCVQIIVESGRPVLGTWQKIFLCEFDGPKARKVFLKFQGKTA
ncbi:MAG: secondary thiamine-phosphate synthase enzyme YjbQ [Syntrophobacteraceae bacterium]